MEQEYTQNLLVDNSKPSLQMVGLLKKLIANPNCNRIRIATGYWDLPGTNLIYDELKGFLERGGRLDILIGQEPMLFPYQRCDLPEGEKFPDFFIRQDLEKLKDEYQAVGQLLVDNVNFEDEKNSPVRIHVYGQEGDDEDQFLHAKCYILTGPGFAKAVMGSSNFTAKGLQGNAELNALETERFMITSKDDDPDYPDSKSYVMWFEEKWKKSRAWSGKFISMLRNAPIGRKLAPPKAVPPAEPADPAVPPPTVADPLTPYELYIKLLQYKFRDVLDTGVGTEIKAALPPSYMPLEYQIDAVKQCCSIMHEHGGFMLGDVVGLGKTVIGTLVVRRFLDNPGEREAKVLIVTPPAVKSAWERTIEEFDAGKGDKIASHVEFVTVGSIGKLLGDAEEDEDGILDDDDDAADTGDFEDELKHENYGLILIDESHKFRNAGTAMYRALDELIARIGLSGHGYPYVGLLSATPQNNAPSDLRNQIYLFQRDRKCSTLENVPGKDLEAFFARVGKTYNELRAALKDIVTNPEAHGPNDRDAIKAEIQSLAVEIRDSVLCDILVRRTRTDVKLHYAADMAAQHLVFPEISGPHEFKYVMDGELAQLFADTMDLIAPSAEFKLAHRDYLCYWRYQAVRFLGDAADREKYRFKNLDVVRFCEQLAAMTQTGLVKRLESSFSAFKRSLRNLRDSTDNMIKMWENDTIFICPQIDVNAELDVFKLKKRGKGEVVTFERCCDDIREKIARLDAEGRNEKGRNHEYTRESFASVGGQTYIEALRRDYALLNELCNRWNEITYDPKLEVFKQRLNTVLFDPATNTSGRLVIFSESIDTVNAIRESAEHLGFAGKVLTVTAKNRHESEKKIRENFDANYEGERKDDYRILVTTEVLAEGVNLHRANCILNYDTPWNSTRLMQRIGRVNRIGSSASHVYVYNFMPSAEGNRLIQLVETAYTKLQTFHTLFGEDSKVFTEAEEVSHYQLNAMVDGEESIYEKYKTELRNYKAAHPERYAQLLAREEGLYGAADAAGTRWFVVASPTTTGLPVRCDPGAGKGEVISYKDLFAGCRPDEDAAPAPLPADWNASVQTAIQAFGQHMTKLNSHVRNSAEAIAAKKAIHLISDTFAPADGSRLKGLLLQAYAAVDKGNRDIVNRVLAVAHEIENGEGALLPVTAAEVEAALARHLEKALSGVVQKLGTPFVYLGLVK